MYVSENGVFCFINSAKIDYNLYRKFWALQDFFRNPTQCYTTEGWKKFTEVKKKKKIYM